MSAQAEIYYGEIHILFIGVLQAAVKRLILVYCGGDEFDAIKHGATHVYTPGCGRVKTIILVTLPSWAGG